MMKFILISLLLLKSSLDVQSSTLKHQNLILSSKKFSYTNFDENVGSNLSGFVKQIQTGYVSNDSLKKMIRETERSPAFRIFLPLLKSVESSSSFKDNKELLNFCKTYNSRNETLPLEKKLEKLAGNFCREKVLQKILKSFSKTNNITDEEIFYINDNLKAYLSKRLKNSFSNFLQAINKNKALFRKVSDLVTQYSVLNQVVPSQEVLKDIEINEQITKLIQIKGFNPLQHQNVFYAEFNKLIEQGSKILNLKDAEVLDADKVKTHFSYLKNFIELNQDHIPLGLCLSKLNDLAKIIYRGGLVDVARSIFHFIIKKNDETILQDAFFFYLWTYIRLDDVDGALNFVEKHKLSQNRFKIIDPRLQFWVAQTFEDNKKPKEAISQYEQIIKVNPLSFYAIMAAKKLSILKPKSDALSYYTIHAKNIHQSHISESDLDEDFIHSLVRLKIWTKINNVKYRNYELKRLNSFSVPNLIVKFPTEKQLSIKSELHFLNALILQSSNYLISFQYLYEAFEKREVLFNKTLIEILYPQPYLPELKTSLAKDNIDPLIVLSLVRQESVFNPLARSPVGARGLMQLMPATAKRFRKYSNVAQLNQPKLNIDIGTKYFKVLLNRYNNNLVYVLAAYNAGESRVERWKNLYWSADQSILRNIEEIPFLETRNYVKLIFRNIFFYKTLFMNAQQNDNQNFNQIFDIHLGFKF